MDQSRRADDDDSPGASGRSFGVALVPLHHALCSARVLLGEGANDRKVWIETRLRELAEIFGVAVGGCSVLDNHVHVLVRLDPEVVQGWSAEEVVRRWGRLFRRGTGGAVADGGIGRLGPGARAERGLGGPGEERLQSLSWFMKGLTRQGRKSEIRNSKSETNKTQSPDGQGFCAAATGSHECRSLAVAAEETGPGSTPRALLRVQSPALPRCSRATGFATRGQPGRMPGILTPLRNPDQSPVRHRLVPSPESPRPSARRGPPEPRNGRDAGDAKPVADTASTGIRSFFEPSKTDVKVARRNQRSGYLQCMSEVGKLCSRRSTPRHASDDSEAAKVRPCQGLTASLLTRCAAAHPAKTSRTVEIGR